MVDAARMAKSVAEVGHARSVEGTRKIEAWKIVNRTRLWRDHGDNLISSAYLSILHTILVFHVLQDTTNYIQDKTAEIRESTYRPI